mmetsp:Transcript_13617/g.40463  ORF Transcript_13617/g.40463 Transcript_13617/m.40463 type:complete len:216 (+) Transcript_13617:695-1342(+)
MILVPATNSRCCMALTTTCMSVLSRLENMKELLRIGVNLATCSAVLGYSGGVKAVALFQFPYASALTDARCPRFCGGGGGMSSATSSSSSSSLSGSSLLGTPSATDVAASLINSRMPRSSFFSCRFSAAKPTVRAGASAMPPLFRSHWIMKAAGSSGTAKSSSCTICSRSGSNTSTMYFLLSSGKASPSIACAAMADGAAGGVTPRFLPPALPCR